MKLLFTVLLSVLVLSCTNNKTYNISEFHLNGHKKVVNISYMVSFFMFVAVASAYFYLNRLIKKDTQTPVE